MLEIQKMRVLVHEEYIDATLRFLGHAKIVQFIDLKENPEEWKDNLTPYTDSNENSSKCSELLSKIETAFETLHIKPDIFPVPEIPITKETTQKVLAKVEQQLSELPIEEVKIYGLASRIDQIIKDLGIKPEQFENGPSLTPCEEMELEHIEFELIELDKTIESTGLLDHHVLVEKIAAKHLDDFDEIGQKFAELSKFVIESERYFGERLVTLKKTVESIESTIEGKINFDDIRNQLLIMLNVVEEEKRITKEKEKFVRSSKIVFFEAWVPNSFETHAVNRIKEASEGNCMIYDEFPNVDEKYPIIPKKCPSYMQAFGKLECAYGLPGSGDIDPLKIFAITFPILFGIMFADVGQGAIFVLLGIALTFLRKKGKVQSQNDIINYLLISGEMLVYIGVSAIFFGFIFGEFFGPSGLIHPITLARIGPFQIGGFEPTQEPMKMLRFAILVGTIHISIGLVLRLINEINHKHYKFAPIPVCWIWLIFGSLFMWAYYGGISNISLWFSEGMVMLGGLMILPLMLIFVFSALAEGLMVGVGFTVEVFAETLSHAMSYSRLMALGLIHSAMNYLFLVLGGVEHGVFPLTSIPLIAIGTILVMIIEGLVVFVHTLRLHWVEWFSTFHSGEGIPFKPFESTT
ncbi:MAG: V-type ATPase 116kDa subunit family protein [Candidatus Bathyarchaeum tardum]|nr:MAG: V-type ATPase 116kDa subunit family protein [Candidatus Bathyarchaeum tardum]